MRLPALEVQGIDLPRIDRLRAGAEGQRIRNRLGEAQLGAYQADAARQRQVNAMIPGAVTGQPGAMEDLVSVDPDMATKIIDARKKMTEAERDTADRKTEKIARSIAYIKGLPELARPEAYRQEIARLEAAGIDTSQMQPDYSPDVLARGEAMTTELKKLFDEADTARFTDIADPTKHGLPRGTVAQRGPKGELKVIYKPGGEKDGASVMERLRWMYAFGEDPETGKKVDDEARAAAGKALAPGSADTPDKFERDVYEILLRGFSSHEDARASAKKARDAFFDKSQPEPESGGGGLVPEVKGAEPAFSGPLPPDVPIEQMSVEQAQDFLEAGGDSISEDDLKRLRDRLKELIKP